jgi:hypothetical protein
MMQYTLVNMILLLTIYYAFYCTLDEFFFARMLDLCNDCGMCTYVSNLFQHWLKRLRFEVFMAVTMNNHVF